MLNRNVETAKFLGLKKLKSGLNILRSNSKLHSMQLTYYALHPLTHRHTSDSYPHLLFSPICPPPTPPPPLLSSPVRSLWAGGCVNLATAR